MLVKGFVDEVVIVCSAEVVARHPRLYGRGEFAFDPRHYLALIERKPGALDQAAPLQGWTLPESLQHLRRLLEARHGQVARQARVHPGAAADGSVPTKPPSRRRQRDARIRLGVLIEVFDAVKQLVLAGLEQRPVRLDLTAYPYLPAPTVRTTAAADYAVLLSRKAA